MANWKYKLPLSDIWKKVEKSEIYVKEAGLQIAKRIRESDYFENEKDNDLESIVMDFEMSIDDIETFDVVMQELYDWADQELPTKPGMMRKKMCWVETF